LHNEPTDAVTLRPAGAMRFVTAAFLGLWLAGWMVGEVIAAAVLVVLVLSFFGGSPDASWTMPFRSLAAGGFGFVFLFLVLWLTGWTIGGLAAIDQFLRSIAGRDRLRLVPEGLEVTRGAGPFRRVTVFHPTDIRRVRIRPKDYALVADTKAGCTVLTDLGAQQDRESLCAWIRDRLHLATPVPIAFDPAVAPAGWAVDRDETGAMRLFRPRRSRHIAATILWLIAAAVIAGSLSQADAISTGVSSFPTILAFLALLAGAAWLTWGHSEWIVRNGTLTHRLRFGPWIRVRTFEHAHLETSRTTDSDGDMRYELLVRGAEGTKTIESQPHDDVLVLECAHWLQEATGFQLKRGTPASFET
jgi:hypothetical protein